MYVGGLFPKVSFTLLGPYNKDYRAWGVYMGVFLFRETAMYVGLCMAWGLQAPGSFLGYLYNRDDGKLLGHPRCTRAQDSEHRWVGDSLNPKPNS